MLKFFLEPYPDEWWYSVMSRYAVRSGMPNSKVVEELFGKGIKRINGSFVPGNSCYKIISQLPPGYLDIENVLLTHTLLPYFLRMYPVDMKKVNFDLLCHGDHMEKTKFEVKGPNGESGPQFCPICYEEDKRNFGEPYWHLEHQIPLMRVCIRHRCRLKRIVVSHNFLNRMFFPLSSVKNEQGNFNIEQWETDLSLILKDFLELPYYVGPTIGYNNLRIFLAARYFTRQVRQSPTFDSYKVKEACEAVFPQEIIRAFFAKQPKGTYHVVTRWRCRTPERYALLCVLAGMTAQQLFGPKLDRQDEKTELFLQLIGSGKSYTREEVAAFLNMNIKSLKKMVEQCEVQPSWSRAVKRGRYEHITVCVSPSELEKLCQYIGSNENRKIADYIREVIFKNIGQ